MDQIVIRTPLKEEANSVARMISRSIRGLCAEVYDDREMNAVCLDYDAVALHFGDSTFTHWIAVSSEVVVGYLQFKHETGRISGLFVDPDHIGQGIGARLIKQCETVARTIGLDRIHLGASQNAVGFYRRQGFVVTAPHKHSDIQSVQVTNVPMAKPLSKTGLFLDRKDIYALLGALPRYNKLHVEVLESMDCGTYVQEHIRYTVETDDYATAFVLVPKQHACPAPAVFCHHQHTEERIGSYEIIGVQGNPNLAYAKELAMRGYIAFAPDAITFGDRRFAEDPVGYAYWELVTRLVKGNTLLAKVLHDIFVGLDYLESRDEVDGQRIGMIGHSYGGRATIWTAALDHRIKAAVCNCGCIAYKHSLTKEAGVQMEFVVQGIAERLDIEDMVRLIAPNKILLSGTTEDKWCRGLQDIFAASQGTFTKGSIELNMSPGGHEFSPEKRDYAYGFLDKHLKQK